MPPAVIRIFRTLPRRQLQPALTLADGQEPPPDHHGLVIADRSAGNRAAQASQTAEVLPRGWACLLWEKMFISCSLRRGPHASSATIIMNHAGTVKEQESSPRARRLCSLARALLLVLSEPETLKGAPVGGGGPGTADSHTDRPHRRCAALVSVTLWGTHSSQPV